ncbi:MAG: DUF2804 domain-containing protein [Deltaproteobacteria bacterium]|nr:DUF2804 domain-containing protein [Deltaproteobacteria bacterium]
MRTLLPTPQPAVGPDGVPAWGVFRLPFRELNLEDARVPGLLRRVRLKEWHHVALIHPEVYVSVAVVDLKYATASWVFVHHRDSDHAFEHAVTLAGRRVVLPSTLWDARWDLDAGPGYRIAGRDHLAAGEHGLDLRIRGAGERPGIDARLTFLEDPGRVQPLVAILPLGRNRPMYTHKVPCPARGSITVGTRTYTLDPGRDLAILDIHKAYYPRTTTWRWATFAVPDPGGLPTGVNLTRNVIEDDEVHNENALWEGGRLHLLGPARFEVPPDPRAPWRIHTLDGAAELEFRPRGGRTEDRNLLVASSWYRQPVGLYSGTVRDGTGREHRFQDVWGIAEDHRVVW